MSTLRPDLRIFAKLDTGKLTKEFKEVIAKAEGTFEAVDLDRPRDLPWTQEIMASIDSYLVVDEDGEVLVEVDTFEKADRVRRSAKVTFAVELEDEEG